MANNLINIPVSLGELWDKYTILIIKKNKINNAEKLKHVEKELSYLEALCKENEISISFYNDLLEINTKLWEIEDAIRKKESEQSFDEEFISIARSVYKNNDIRASIKHQINTKYNSILCEVKDY